MFKTFGPFALKDISPRGIDSLYDQVELALPGLQYGIGVYIFAADTGKGPIPLYVGKAFRQRFGRRNKISNLINFTNSLRNMAI